MASKKAKTIDDYRGAYDKDVIVPRKIQAALDAMLAIGPEEWDTETDLVRAAGISQTDIGKYRDKFLKHIVVAPAVGTKASRNIWFGSAKVAAKLRGE